jgi:hypothetical protein
MENKNYIMVGIDPALRKDGFAACIVDEDNNVDFKRFFSPVDALFWFLELKKECLPNIYFCIENSNLQDCSFSAPALIKQKKYELAVSRALDEGKNMGVSQLTSDFLELLFGSFNIYDVSPKEKGAKIEDPVLIDAMASKFGHVFIKKTKLNQDERDAYLLATIGIEIKEIGAANMPRFKARFIKKPVKKQVQKWTSKDVENIKNKKQ